MDKRNYILRPYGCPSRQSFRRSRARMVPKRKDARLDWHPWWADRTFVAHRLSGSEEACESALARHAARQHQFIPLGT
ncbi:hypothetical protein Tasa_030_006 [Tanticharoenia sakaeratensis NBRC 103193]|uniref:Uncharacterized protein n=1 Tax=Tanticharoenia sakaeratensis NBRC 103193 TaxID=1231623 RepID=A0A0D6MM91_9PROT|nr:hypothetical protein Tasa_030_006 [Tanticharoenia sakaeratensis NBRC 103193]GBQ25396.1 hypothetical protein AA103193_3074 [Tanticharoenia sakaeratensis NBRC 103193]